MGDDASALLVRLEEGKSSLLDTLEERTKELQPMKSRAEFAYARHSRTLHRRAEVCLRCLTLLPCVVLMYSAGTETTRMCDRVSQCSKCKNHRLSSASIGRYRKLSHQNLGNQALN